MSTREISDARVSVESSLNGTIVKEQPLLDLGTPQLQGYPRRSVQDQGGRSSSATSAVVSRLLPIEGLGPTWHYGWWPAMFCGSWAWSRTLAGLSRLPRTAQPAVDLFIIISGFVIMLALDKHRETYVQFAVSLSRGSGDPRGSCPGPKACCPTGNRHAGHDRPPQGD